jgi:hypothetical protein
VYPYSGVSCTLPAILITGVVLVIKPTKIQRLLPAIDIIVFEATDTKTGCTFDAGDQAASTNENWHFYAYFALFSRKIYLFSSF